MKRIFLNHIKEIERNLTELEEKNENKKGL